MCAKVIAFLIAISVACHASAARIVAAFGSSDYVDTEAVTNIAFTADSPHFITLGFVLNAFGNNAELTFGNDADADGALSVDEEVLCVGWDCGAWKIVDCRDMSSLVFPGPSGARCHSHWRLWFSGTDVHAIVDGVQRSFAASAPIAQSSFNMVKVVCRGLTSPGLTVRHPANPKAFRVIIR